MKVESDARAGLNSSRIMNWHLGGVAVPAGPVLTAAMIWPKVSAEMSANVGPYWTRLKMLKSSGRN